MENSATTTFSVAAISRSTIASEFSISRYKRAAARFSHDIGRRFDLTESNGVWIEATSSLGPTTGKYQRPDPRNCRLGTTTGTRLTGIDSLLPTAIEYATIIQASQSALGIRRRVVPTSGESLLESN
jgi:hypothetical protein